MDKKIAYLIVLASVAFSASALDMNMYYTRATAVTADANQGLVYISEQPSNPAITDYKTKIQLKTQSQMSDASHTYNMYALPKDGYVFDYWTDKAGNKFTIPYRLINGKESSLIKPTEDTFTAHFKPRGAVAVTSNNLILGTAKIVNSVKGKGNDNEIGDEITLVAHKEFPYTSPANGGNAAAVYRPSDTVNFDGWYDSDGVCVSTEEQYTFTVTEKADYTARFSWTPSVTGPGYYRVRYYAHDDDYMTVFGDYDPGFSLNQQSLKGTVGLSYSKSNPASVLKLTGNIKKVTDPSREQEVMSSTNLGGQGTDIRTVMGVYFKLNTANTPGYYKLKYTTFGMTISLCVTGADKRPTTNINVMGTRDKPYMNYGDYICYFEFEPLDEAHMDKYYFGAEPDESMQYDGGYWTSMYTSFPYECRDGVEAYFIKTINTDWPVPVAVLERIEGDRVPSECAVLLKCQGLTPAENRLLPLMEEPSVDVSGNLLHGEYQLKHSENDTNFATFEGSRMRVFGCGQDGTPGFYRMAEGTTLAANKAWLDVSSLGAAGAAKIMLRNDLSGVENVVADESGDVDTPIYDIMGRRVTHTEPGRIYIRNGRKFLAR